MSKVCDIFLSSSDKICLICKDKLMIILVLSLLFTGNLACDCGISLRTRIYKGMETVAHKYPWLALIRREIPGKTPALCGGTVLDKLTILTAAHCVVNASNALVDKSYLRVYLGAHHVYHGEEFNVTLIAGDAEYDATISRMDLDIAMLKLDRQIIFNEKIQPICIPLETEIPYSHDFLIAGWGLQGKTFKSNSLREAMVSVLSREDCYDRKVEFYKSFGKDKPLPDSEYQICAINETTYADACAGDSGGPLMLKNEYGRHYGIGIISGGWAGCAEAKIPGLYTSVQMYLDFIKVFAEEACFKSLNE